jgi:hypothetical protein
MSEAGILTLTCPHCAKRVYAKSTDAGRRVRCPHLDCRKAVPVPLPMGDEDEPEEAVLIPEDPADPAPVAKAPVVPRAAPAPTAAPKPRRKPRRYEEDEDAAKKRAAILPWALTAVACLLASGAVAGWVISATQAPSSAGTDGTADRVAALESKNRELRAENLNLRTQLDKAKPVTIAPAPKEPDIPAPAPPWFNDPPPGRFDPPPNRFDPKPPDEPKPPKPIEPPAKPAVGRDAFVGKWSVESPELKKQGIEIDMTVEFREDGTCRVEARVAGSSQDLNGKWRWEGRRLHVEMDQSPDAGKPAEVKWNGPDEFTMTGAGDNMTATFRRKK